MKSKKWYVNFGTGEGDEYIEGELDTALAFADNSAAYTSADIKVYSVDDEGKISETPACMRWWVGIKFDPDLYEDGEYADIIDFGEFGYYDEWSDDL